MFYTLGVFLALVIFDKDIAMASVLILAIGDSIAAIVGQYGDMENPFNRKKYLEGSIAGAIVAGLTAALFVSPLEAGLAATASMIAEGVDLRLEVNQLDDNIVMTLVAGFIIWFLRLGVV